MKRIGGILNDGFGGVNIFDESDPGNRDDSLQFIRLLKKNFMENGIELIQLRHASENRSVDFQIHFEVPESPQSESGSVYLFRFESEPVYPLSYSSERLRTYRRVFSWNSDSVAADKFSKICIPNTYREKSLRRWADRDRLICLIAGNKCLPVENGSDLYVERIRAIRWFEKNALGDFDLYGVGWGRWGARRGLFFKVINRLTSYVVNNNSRFFFPSYRGSVKNKFDTYARYRFAICYENLAGIPDYITEKIFDCFFSGVIPVYWGASNISSYIPEDCFIDRRNFSGTEDVYRFIRSISESRYNDYQLSIDNFLRGKKSEPFWAKSFAETVVRQIVVDLDT